MSRAKIAVLGATGRLGSALQRQWGRQHLLGLARHPPADAAQWAEFVSADRRNTLALQDLLSRCDAVVDLCGFDLTDAQALLQAVQQSGRTGLRLIAASSVAERPIAYWNQPEHGASPPPSDDYGLHKRHYSDALLQHWPGPALAVLLPNLLQVHPVDPRLRRWWQEAAQTGVAPIPGSGQQNVALLPTQTAAELIAQLLQRPDLIGRLALACPRRPTVLALASALFGGMAPAPRLQPGAPAGLFSAGPEILALDALLAALPGFAWPDLIAVFADLGGQLARDPPGN